MRIYPRQLSLRRNCAAVSLLLACAINTFAHDPGLSTASVRLQAGGIHIALVLSVKDASELVSLDRNHDGQTPRPERAASEAALTARAGEAFEVTIDEQPATIATAKCSLDDDNAALNLQVASRAVGRLQIRSRWLALLPPGHRQFLTVQNARGEVLVERLLSSNSDSVILELPSADSAAAEHPAATSSFVDFLGLGVKHILIGYDHLLFLFSLLIVSRSLLAPVKLITCFTIAHSTTLALATFDLVRIPGSVVEPLIAGSIVFVALENLVRRGEPKGRMWLVFAFGLIHGLGFASVLRELGVGTTGIGVALPLLSFNLGVELGQLLLAALVIPLVRILSERPAFAKRWVPACSVLAAFAGGFWLVQRVCFAA